jgi:hypothetical protein
MQGRPWWPDARLAKVVMSRRLQFRLITRRYEMLDLVSGQLAITADAEEALDFLGNLRYVSLLGPENAGTAGVPTPHDWHLMVDFRMEREGVSPLFRILNRLLAWQPIIESHLHRAYPRL